MKHIASRYLCADWSDASRADCQHVDPRTGRFIICPRCDPARYRGRHRRRDAMDGYPQS